MTEEIKEQENAADEVNTETCGENTADNTAPAADKNEECGCEGKKSKCKKSKKEDKELTALQEKYDELNDRYMRMMAEYDNFRKRAAKEKEGTYADAYCDALKEILPIMDNVERAAQFTEGDKVVQGVQMILTQFSESLKKLGVEEIGTEEGFDPNFHNAVMHIEDESYGENAVVDVFQKGYKKGDKVIRHAMVRVAN